ncbi:gluconokinase [Haloferula sargassicola]|uniref:Gluconokinase n=1 Tax=Haloferula sargassicola TaxID=490096 RepID=A0ABP9UH79_9BACT
MPVKPKFTLVIMGVSGSGKSTVGKLVADHTDSDFADADDFHPPANRGKMAAGVPLDDADRRPWLEALRDHIRETNEAGRTLVVACSALKRKYRDLLREAGPQVVFVFLDGSREQLLERLNSRQGHFFPPALLDSQLAALERPQSALVLDISAPPEALAEQILVPFFNRPPGSLV